jgi:hypothetical protein
LFAGCGVACAEAGCVAALLLRFWFVFIGVAHKKINDSHKNKSKERK